MSLSTKVPVAGVLTDQQVAEYNSRGFKYGAMVPRAAVGLDIDAASIAFRINSLTKTGSSVTATLAILNTPLGEVLKSILDFGTEVAIEPSWTSENPARILTFNVVPKDNTMQQVAKTYLYTISRRDIPLAQQAVQAAHAAVEHAYAFGRPEDHHPSYIHLTAKTQAQLLNIQTRLNAAGIQTAEFHEPYQDWGLTAIACILTEETRHLLKNFPLWRLPTQEAH